MILLLFLSISRHKARRVRPKAHLIRFADESAVLFGGKLQIMQWLILVRKKLPERFAPEPG